MNPGMVAAGLLALGLGAAAVGTLGWLRGWFDPARDLELHEQMDALRAIALERARANGHDVVGPSIDVWVYSCSDLSCLGTVGVVEGHHGEPVIAGTMLVHGCPTAVPTSWDAPTHHRHGGPAHSH